MGRRKRYALNVSHHVWQTREAEGPTMHTGADFAAMFEDIANADREMVFAVSLNQRNEVIDRHMVSMGTLTASLLHPREAFKAAIVDSAAAVAFVHNHPSGNPQPSIQDRELCEKLNECCRLLGIRFTDFVIVAGHSRYYSFAACGLL